MAGVAECDVGRLLFARGGGPESQRRCEKRRRFWFKASQWISQSNNFENIYVYIFIFFRGRGAKRKSRKVVSES